MINVYDFNGNVWETPHVEGKVPLPRYAHSCVLFGDKIFMYGGVLPNSTVTNEIWAFDVSAKVWENVTVHDNFHNNKTIRGGPLKVVYLSYITSFLSFLNISQQQRHCRQLEYLICSDTQLISERRIFSLFVQLY